MLDIRTTVLHEEHQAAIDQHQGLKEQLAAKRETVSTLKHEREDCLARLRKVQKELQLIEEFERQELEAVEHLKEEEQKMDEEARFIQNALQPLR